MGINTKSTKTAAPTLAQPARRGEILWEDAPTEFTKRVSLAEVYGDPGTGKTTFALSAPGPIAYLHAAEKIDGVIQKFSREKKVRIYNFNGTFRGAPRDIAAQAQEVWKGLRAAWVDAFGWARTIVLDTHTEAWELIRVAYFGALKPEGGRIDANYGPVNAEWKSLLKHFRTQDRCNLILLGQTKEEYKTSPKSPMGERTGRTIRAGQKDVPYFADVILRMDKADGDFTATIEKGWFNGPMEGVPYMNEDVKWSTIMSAITETDPEEWE